MTLDDYLRIGEPVTLGTHKFEPDEIKAFARKYDPQPFHVDEEAAKNSVFGALCASGWHTAATWMRYNVAARDVLPKWEGPGEEPKFGPSPGFVNLKWLKPVYAGDTITFRRTALKHRSLATRLGWHVVTMKGEAFDNEGTKVIEFESSVLLKAA